MTERTSERIWRAARAAYESRGQLKVFMPWDDLRQVSRDIEYDAMVTAFDAATAPALKARLAAHPGCMEPDGAEPCPQYTAALARIAELEAEVRRLQNNEVNDCDLLGVHERRIAELEAALKPFAEYAERIEKERPGWKMAPMGIPMAWFIAALKVCRGEAAPPSEEDMKYDNDGYPDLPREPTVTIPRAQHEALIAAAKAAETYYRGYAQDEADEEGICGKAQQDAARELRDALAALRAAGIDLSEPIKAEEQR